MKIDLTDREMQLLIDCIGTNIETVRRRHDPSDCMIAELLTELADLDMDLREALHRQDDGWSDPDLLMDPVDFAAKHDTDPISIAICDAEINAETASSRAAGRRALNFREASDEEAPDEDNRSEVENVDIWDPNDPTNW